MPVDLIPDLDNANVGTLAPGAIWKLRFYEEPPFQAASLFVFKKLFEAFTGVLYEGQKREMEGCAVIINGVQEAAEGKSVAQVLQEKGIDLSNVAVERNGEIVPKRQYDSVILTAEDRLEIVSFVGGG